MLFNVRPLGSKNPLPFLAVFTAAIFIIFMLGSTARRTRLNRLSIPPPLFNYSTDLTEDVHNRTLGFEKVFAINLPVRTDKKDAMVLSAVLSDIDLDFIDGVFPEEVLEKAIPYRPGAELNPGPKGCWRAHMNVYLEMVEKGISSALILEDDVDWDIRLKSQLHSFALSSQALTQPLLSGKHADPSYPHPPPNSVPNEMFFDDLPQTQPPQHSPYGDEWEILWLGHSGNLMADETEMHGADQTPKGRVIQRNDTTVAEMRYLWTMQDFSGLFPHPQHTRVVHHPIGSVGLLAYAITQSAARKMLYDFGIWGLGGPIDLAISDFCTGSYGRIAHNCLGVTPSIFGLHLQEGSMEKDSDSSDFQGYRDRKNTNNVRWPVKMNFDRLLKGEDQYFEQFPDSETVVEEGVKEVVEGVLVRGRNRNGD